MEEAHRKLYIITEDDPQNLSWWWKASFDEVGLDRFVQNHGEKHSDDVIDSLFNYEEAKLA